MSIASGGSLAAETMVSAVTNTRLYFPAFILITAACLSMRIEDLSYIEQSLWYEDGFVYITQAFERGIRSLWMPTGGYQNLYARIVAFAASYMPLVVTPYVYSSAWFFAFSAIIWVLIIRGRALGIHGALAVFLTCAVALQPNHGEPFFNLNHAYFFLGIALALYLCTPTSRPISLFEALFLGIACLSGPFSAIMLPLLVLQLILLRDFSVRKSMYLIGFSCGLIQLMYLSQFRVGTISSEGPARWMNTIGNFLFFGSNERIVRVVSILFWTITLVYFVRWVRYKRGDVRLELWLSPILSVLAVIGFFVVCVSSSKHFLPLLSPLDMGARYFLIPYSLSFFIAIITTKEHKSALTAVIAMVSVICATGPLIVDREDRAASTGVLSHVNMQWTAFAKFQSIKPDIMIPINASLPMYPPVHARIRRSNDFGEMVGGDVGPFYIVPIQGEVSSEMQSVDRPPSAEAVEQSPSLYFDITGYCAGNRYVAVEADLWRSRMGWAIIYWGHYGSFDSRRSLSRFYPDGTVTMQFAFRRSISDQIIRFDPAEGVADSAAVRTVHEPWMSPIRSLAAEPTKAGGELRVGQVRLYCLK